MTDHIAYYWGRLLCALLNVETTACRGRQACRLKHGHMR